MRRRHIVRAVFTGLPRAVTAGLCCIAAAITTPLEGTSFVTNCGLFSSVGYR